MCEIYSSMSLLNGTLKNVMFETIIIVNPSGYDWTSLKSNPSYFAISYRIVLQDLYSLLNLKDHHVKID